MRTCVELVLRIGYVRVFCVEVGVNLYGIRPSPAISLASNLPSGHTKIRTLSTFSSVLCDFSCPPTALSCKSSRPSSNPICHSKTLDLFIAYSSKVNANRADVSL
jgi:hypothetical protein